MHHRPPEKRSRSIYTAKIHEIPSRVFLDKSNHKIKKSKNQKNKNPKSKIQKFQNPKSQNPKNPKNLKNQKIQIKYSI